MPLPHKSSYDIFFTFGKYGPPRSYSLGQVAEINPGFLDWLIGANGIPMVWKEAAARTLQGLTVEALNLPRTKAIPRTEVIQPEMSAVNVDKGIVGVRFPKQDGMVAQLKYAIDGIHWVADDNNWQFPKEQIFSAVEFFGGTGKIIADAHVRAWYEAEDARKKTLSAIRKLDDIDLETPGLLHPLRSYQKVAIRFAEAAGDRWMDADDPGLGKTPTALAWALRKGGKTLVIVPKAVVDQWYDQIKKFVGVKACIWSATGVEGDIKSQIHVVNYDIVPKLAEKFRSMKFDNLICDEATKVKNYQSLRAKAIFGNWKERKEFPGLKIPRLCLLTGTPVLNRVMEYFTLLSFIDKKRFNNPQNFKARYEISTNPHRLKELHDRAVELVIRRKKSVVATEIPKKSFNRLVLRMTDKQKIEYDEHLKALFGKWRQIGRPSAAQMPAIRRYLFDLKFDLITDTIDELLEAERPVIVFAVQKPHVERIAAHYGKNAAFIHAGVSSKARTKAKQDFIAGRIKVLVMTILTGGMGLDGLQEVCSDAVFTERWWTPGDHEQAEDRLNRIGQVNPTMMYYFTVQESCDEDMEVVLDEKRDIIERAVDGKVDEGDLAHTRTGSVFGEVYRRMVARYQEPELVIDDALEADDE
jgi:SNF2 family DNA or RNA helicase